MRPSSPRRSDKPYEIRERLLLFACDVIRTAQKLHTRGPIAAALSVQLVNAAVSAASNAEEADDGSSRRDFLAKERICLREIKESRLRLRVLRATGYLDESHDALIAESSELVRIVATIVHKTQLALADEIGPSAGPRRSNPPGRPSA